MSFSKNNLLSTGWLHPVLLTFYFIAGVWYDSGKAYWSEMGLTLLLSAGVLGGFWLLFAILAGKNRKQASIPATLMGLLLFNATYLQFSVFHESIRFRVTFLVVLALLAGLSFSLRYVRSRLTRIHLYLNLVILASGAWLGWKWISYPEEILNPPAIQARHAGEKDVYLIIMDAYAASHNLKKYWNYDNTPFTDSLRRKGFRVFSRPHSNYNMTERTLGTMLNISHLNNLEKPRSTPLLMDHIPENVSGKLFRTQGYRIGWFSLFQEYPGDMRPGASFRRVHFLIYAALRSAAYFVPWVYNRMPGVVEEPLGVQFRELAGRAESFRRFVADPAAGKRFGYYHCMYSHPTYLVNAKGFYPGVTNVPEMKAYAGTLPYTERHILGVIDTILKTGRPAVIVLMSDHGYRGLTKLPAEEIIGEGFENFISVYESGETRSDWYEGITPINVWRKVLNHTFGTGLPMLEDKYGR